MKEMQNYSSCHHECNSSAPETSRTDRENSNIQVIKQNLILLEELGDNNSIESSSKEQFISVRPSTTKRHQHGHKIFFGTHHKESEDEEDVNEDDVANERDSVKMQINFNCIDEEDKQERLNRNKNRV